MIIKLLKVTGLVLLAGVLGCFIVIAVFFGMERYSDIPYPTYIFASLASLLTGLIIGFISPTWWPLAGLTSWWISGKAISNLIGEYRPQYWFLLMPLGTALVGGYLGRLMRTIRF